MEIRIKDAISYLNYYQRASKEPMPTLVAWKLFQAKEQLTPALEFYQNEFNNILSQYGQKDANGNFIYTEDGTGIKMEEGKNVECQEKIVGLQNLTRNIADFTIDIDDLPMEITLEELDVLSKIFIIK